MAGQKKSKLPIAKSQRFSDEQERAMAIFRPMWEYGKSVGCPQQQMENFTKANLFLQPKQLEFAARCRECDVEGGPTAVMFGGGRGSAKALALDTPILTRFGWKTMGSLQVGDGVFDERGNVCYVMAKSDVFHGHDCYELEFDDGERIVADAGHRWLTTSKAEQKAIDRRNDGFREKRRLERGNVEAKPWLVGKNVMPMPPDGTVKTTEQIFRSVKIQSGRETNHRIRVTLPLEFHGGEAPINPYLLGLWLGDGSKNSGRITSDDPEIFDRLRCLEIECYKMNQKFEWRIVGMTERLKELGLFDNKHIPVWALFAPVEQRLDLLRGLMDSDGCCTKDGSVTFTNTDKRIIAGFVELVRGLGVKVGIETGISKLYGKECAQYWRIHFCPTFNPFYLKRKADRFRTGTRKTNRNHYIVGCRKIESVPTQCIAVSSPSHLFLAGKSLIPTHNTHAVWAQVFTDDCQRMPGLKVLILRKVGKANQEQVNDYRQKLLGCVPHEYKQQAQELVFPNGSKVILGNFKDEKDIDKYLGLEYDLIAISESNQLTFTKKKFILTCLRTSKAGWRPRLYEDTNPGGVGMAENKAMYVMPWRLGREKESGTRYVHTTVYDNKFINKEYIAQLETLTGWQRKAWLDGDWDFAAGSFFTNFLPSTHVYPNDKVSFDDGKAVRWFASYDFGFAHNAACILFAEDKAGLTYMVDEYCESEQVVAEQAENIRQMLRNHHLEPEDLEFFVAGRDCFSRNEDGKTIAMAFDDLGLSMTVAEVDRANGWKRCHSLFGDVSRGIAPKGYVHQRCKNLITQIELAQHSERRPGDVEKFNADSEGNGGDDCLDAWRFGIASDPSHAIKFAKPVSLFRSPYQMIGLN